LERRLVEPELLFQAGDKGGIEPLRATIFRIAFTEADLILALAEIGTTAADAVHGVAALAGQLSDNPLHRPAGHELHDDETDEQHTEQCRDHEEQAAEDISAHSDRSSAETKVDRKVAHHRSVAIYQSPSPLLRRTTKASQPENHNRAWAP